MPRAIRASRPALTTLSHRSENTDVRFGYYRINNNTVGPDANQPLGNNLGIPNANGGDLSLYGGLPQINIDIPSNGSNGGQNIEYGTSANPRLQQTSQYQIVNNWSHTLGNHNIRFGADYRYGTNHSVSVASNALRSGSYNALQVVFEKRYASGLQFLTHYTWSHAIGHEAYEFLIDPRIGRGNGYYNRRHAFVFAGNYDLPFGRNRLIGSGVPWWVNGIIGEYLLNGTVTVDGGLPFTENYSSCNQDQDLGICFLNKAAGTLQTKKGAYNAGARFVPYFKPSPYVLAPPGQLNNSYGAFSRPAAATFGNVGRDQLWGPGLANVDASIAKNFNIWENLHLQLSAQSFNLFNHPNLNQPNSCIDCQDVNGAGVQNAGTIQGTVSTQDGTSMRRPRFAARFQF